MQGSIVDPAADVRDEVAAASGAPELAEKIWFHRTAAAVIDVGRCVGCGGCVAACPSQSLSVGEDGHPTLTRMCTGCSACWDFCPLAGLRTERLGHEGGVRAAYSARAVDPAPGAQDGGVVTELLATLLGQGDLDGVLLTRRTGAFRGEPFIATTAEQVRATAGSVYQQSHLLSALSQPLPAGVSRLAVVGTPCQLSVLSALRRFPWRYRRTNEHAVTLAIGLFCTRSFDATRLMAALRAEGVDLSRVRTLDIRAGALVARDAAGQEQYRRPVGELHAAALAGCDECGDFTAAAADIAVGNLGSEAGHTTVLVRTPAGKAAWRAGSAKLDAHPLADLTPVTRADRRNQRRADRLTPRDRTPDGPLWVTYPEHLAAYAGTERAPGPVPPHRAHHYQVSC